LLLLVVVAVGDQNRVQSMALVEAPGAVVCLEGPQGEPRGATFLCVREEGAADAAAGQRGFD
jgi:hypothetical protein